jgi:hypothetical protein
MISFHNWRRSSVSPAALILLLFFASFLNQRIRSSPIASPESPQTKNSCEKTPMQCGSLCQTALSAESRAVELEKYSKKARTNADKAAKYSASIEKQLNKKLRKLGLSPNTNTTASAALQSESLWKTASIVPRLLVSDEANARSRKEEKEARQHGSNEPLDMTSQEVSELMVKTRQASDSAEGAQRIAADAQMEAERARAYADSVRQSYKSCLTGKESQLSSP